MNEIDPVSSRPTTRRRLLVGSAAAVATFGLPLTAAAR